MTKLATFGSLITVSVLAVGGYYALSSDTPLSHTNKTPLRNFSVLDEAKKAQVQNQFIEPSVLFASEVKKQDKVKKDLNDLKSPLLKKSYYKNFTQSQEELANNLELLEKEHEVLLQNMRKEGIKIDRITALKPRLAIALTYHLGLDLGELSSTDLERLSLSNREWYIIKTFSESKDFALMLKRESLSSDFIQIDSLTEYYSSNS